MSEQQFADAVGVSRGAVQQWEKPGGTAPKRSNQPLVAKVLGLTVAELVSGVANVGHGAEMRAEVPVLSEGDVAKLARVDNFKPDQRFETVPVSVPVKRHTYALRVHGDTMVSETGDSFPEGSLVVVEPEMESLPGDYVIVLNESNQPTFKQLVRDGGDLYLKPLNSRYPIKPLGKSKVIGVVREFTKRFR